MVAESSFWKVRVRPEDLVSKMSGGLFLENTHEFRKSSILGLQHMIILLQATFSIV